MQVNKNDYFIEVNKIKEKYNVDIKEFERIYKVYEGIPISESGVKIAEKLINDMFGGYGEAMLPLNFIKSNVGTVIMSILVGFNNRVYTMADLMELTGFSRQRLSYDIEVGNLKCDKRTKGLTLFYENDLNDFLEMKGLGTIGEIKSKTYDTQKEEFRYAEFEREVSYGEEGGKQ
ncbi:MAG: hypothetical protein RSA91_00455 [Bacilli bacterium]